MSEEDPIKPERPDYARAAEEAVDEAVASARKMAGEAGKVVEEAVSCFEKDIACLGRTVSDLGNRNPLALGLGIIAVAGVLFASLLGAAASAERRR